MGQCAEHELLKKICWVLFSMKDYQSLYENLEKRGPNIIIEAREAESGVELAGVAVSLAALTLLERRVDFDETVVGAVEHAVGAVEVRGGEAGLVTGEAGVWGEAGDAGGETHRTGFNMWPFFKQTNQV